MGCVTYTRFGAIEQRALKLPLVQPAKPSQIEPAALRNRKRKIEKTAPIENESANYSGPVAFGPPFLQPFCPIATDKATHRRRYNLMWQNGRKGSPFTILSIYPSVVASDATLPRPEGRENGQKVVAFAAKAEKTLTPTSFLPLGLAGATHTYKKKWKTIGTKERIARDNLRSNICSFFHNFVLLN